MKKSLLIELAKKNGHGASKEVVYDEHTKAMIWERGDLMYYHLGVLNPDYCVPKFTTVDGRYYHQLKSESFTIF